MESCVFLCFLFFLEVFGHFGVKECHRIISFIVFSRWFEMSVVTLAYENAAEV